jgi:hypothetical protein
MDKSVVAVKSVFPAFMAKAVDEFFDKVSLDKVASVSITEDQFFGFGLIFWVFEPGERPTIGYTIPLSPTYFSKRQVVDLMNALNYIILG